MDTDAMTDYYWENLKDILQRQLADDDEYRALIQKKIAAEIALKALIGEEAWSLYLELDAISNELESVRQEAMYLIPNKKVSAIFLLILTPLSPFIHACKHHRSQH